MSKFEAPEEIEDYYKKKKIVASYVDKRFTEPIFFIEHRRQAEILNKIIRNYGCTRALEIAPGPARLTKELILREGVALDSSREMLNLARKIMAGKNSNWNFLEGDAFNPRLPKNTFDLIFTFRFVFHFKKQKRKEFYKVVSDLLDENGLFVFEALNRKKVKLVRRFVGEHKYHVFSEMFDKRRLTKELSESGLRVVAFYPHISHFWTEMLVSRVFSFLGMKGLAKRIIYWMEQVDSNNPYQWVVLCQKI